MAKEFMMDCLLESYFLTYANLIVSLLCYVVMYDYRFLIELVLEGGGGGG